MNVRWAYLVKAANNRLFAKWLLNRCQKSESETTVDTTLALETLLNCKQGAIYGKIGTTELLALEYSDRIFQPSWPNGLSWKRQAERLFVDSGVFPVSIKQFEDFLHTYRKSIAALDGITLWQESLFFKKYEAFLADRLCPGAIRLSLGALSPLETMGELASRELLIVSPFVQTMKEQVKKLPDIFRDIPWGKNLSAVYKTCQFVRCPFFSYLEKSPYSCWSEGLQRLSEEIYQRKYEIALVGAGAWSLPLLANIKNSGKKGLHLGGATQIAFGIKGRRWDSYWGKYYNESWIRPLPSETPAGFERKEKGCYW